MIHIYIYTNKIELLKSNNSINNKMNNSFRLLSFTTNDKPIQTTEDSKRIEHEFVI